MARKKLYRNKKNSMLGGVASGLADYFDIDVSLVRIIFIAATILGGGGVIAYLLCWFIVPEKFNENETIFVEEVKAEEPFDVKENIKKEKSKQTNLILGILLICFGMFFILERMISKITFHKFWPVILILAGAIVIIISLTKSKNDE